MKERSLLIIKPEGIRRHLIGDIFSRLEKGGVKFIGTRITRLTAPQARHLYRFQEDLGAFPGLVESITSGPVMLIACEGELMSVRLRKMAGLWNIEPEPGTIAFDFGNVVHASDGKRLADEEVKYFFEEDELI